jgi:hypothetical protein
MQLMRTALERVGLTSPKTACVQDRDLTRISGHLRELVPRHIHDSVGFIIRARAGCRRTHIQRM